jgi:hypothetical protein
MPSYSVYRGHFPCHTCKEEVTTLRLYPATLEATWMCKDKHLSKVSFATKKKRDYAEKENRV